MPMIRTAIALITTTALVSCSTNTSITPSPITGGGINSSSTMGLPLALAINTATTSLKAKELTDEQRNSVIETYLLENNAEYAKKVGDYRKDEDRQWLTFDNIVGLFDAAATAASIYTLSNSSEDEQKQKSLDRRRRNLSALTGLIAGVQTIFGRGESPDKESVVARMDLERKQIEERIKAAMKASIAAYDGLEALADLEEYNSVPTKYGL